jgi:hypothetical protein
VSCKSHNKRIFSDCFYATLRSNPAASAGVRHSEWFMYKNILMILSLFTSSAAFCGSADYLEAKGIWEKDKTTSEYQNYLEQFLQYNNSLRLDEKNGCYKLSNDTVELFLVIKHFEGNKYAIVEDVLVDNTNLKSECFIKTYRNLKLKQPPHFPFVIQMQFG